MSAEISDNELTGAGILRASLNFEASDADESGKPVSPFAGDEDELARLHAWRCQQVEDVRNMPLTLVHRLDQDASGNVTAN
jgi:hypothetical protein